MPTTPPTPLAASNFGDVSINDVLYATWLLPAGVAMPPGRLRRIVRPLPGQPAGILYQVETEGGSTHRRAELGQPTPPPSWAGRRVA